MQRPRFLYHGTTGSHHNGIMFNGILPRACTGRSNWHGKFESNPDLVYLTNTYPTFFAAQAKDEDDTEESATNLVIYEIDTYLLDVNNFCADEDVLTLWAREEGNRLAWNGLGELGAKLRTADRRSQVRSVSAERSLDALGTCAYAGEIPLNAITRGLFYNTKTAAEMILRGLDPVINLRHFALFGEEYQAAVRWLFRFETEEAGILRGMDYYKSQTEYVALDNYCQFNMWRNPNYIGSAEFVRSEHADQHSTILIPVKETIT